MDTDPQVAIGAITIGRGNPNSITIRVTAGEIRWLQMLLRFTEESGRPQIGLELVSIGAITSVRPNTIRARAIAGGPIKFLIRGSAGSNR